jgi:hypothetical protein
MALGWLALCALPAAAQSPAVPSATAQSSTTAGTIGFAELQRGQKGVGYSVFHGQSPQPFDVEVLGVLRGTQMGTDFLVARLGGQGLEKSGVVGGMSGSPVYFDGKLAGAVAFSYLFGVEPIAGITPIGAMHRIPTQHRVDVAAGGRPSPRGGFGAAPLPLAELVARRFDRARFDDWLALLKPAASEAGHSSLTWSAAGFGQRGLEILRGMLPTLRPMASGSGAGGRDDAGLGGGDLGDGDLQPGDAVAMVMVRGDLTLAGFGTVTDRQGDQVVAFGHPAYALGPINLPMAESEVITVFPSVADSFKMCNLGRLAGTFVEDRQAGLRGVVGPVAPMTPLHIGLRLAETGERRDFRLEVASEPVLRPLMVTLGVMGALTHGDRVRGFQSVDMVARLDLGRHGQLAIDQNFDGDQAAMEALIHLSEFARYLEFNELEQIDLRGVDVEFVVHELPRQLRVLDAWPDRRRVEPGETLGVTVELQSWRGVKERRRYEAKIPADAGNGRYYLLVGDGISADAARYEVQKRQPQTLPAILDQLRELHPRRELHLLGLAGSRGLVVEGASLPDLPPSARAVLAPDAAMTLEWRFANEQVFELETPLEGMVRIDLEVRRPKR